jgi:FlaA1/EpsC-like NDP-sugar epimerase
MPAFSDNSEAIEFTPVKVEDLLLRSTVKIDYRRLQQFFAGASVVVTGGGGSIGSEICDRLVTFGVERLFVIEHSEFALTTILDTLAAKGTAVKLDGRLADIRDRNRIFRIISEFAPDFVFHAAALKRVPLLERDSGEAVRTNVFGSVNVADAAVAAGAKAMVMISTDKAIEPMSILGATKRLAEMYCEALDAELLRPAAAATRLISVRFGNVLASNGSVVQKFKAQIEAGGPITVTHPNMMRYFMRIREACDLVLTSATHALGPDASGLSVYVLNMGQPVKIVDLADRLVRLAGREPGIDIEIVFTGIRAGERLNEMPVDPKELLAEVGIPGIVAARLRPPSLDTVRTWITMLERSLGRGECLALNRILPVAVSNRLPNEIGDIRAIVVRHNKD